MLQIHPIRATFSSRSFRSNPRPLHTVERSASASRTSTRHPRRFSSRPTSAASVVFPAQGSPVNQRVNPPAEPAESGVPFADINLLHPSWRVYEAMLLQATVDHGPLLPSSFSLQGAEIYLGHALIKDDEKQR